MAIDRNYLCTKMVESQGNGDQLFFRNEAHASELSEMAPGLWLPQRVEMSYSRRPFGGGAPQVWRRQTLIVDRANTDPKYGHGRFRDVKLPEDLPTYKFDADGFLEDSAMKSVKAPAGDPRELGRMIAELKRQEERCQRYDVSTTSTYRALEARSMPGATITLEGLEHTVALPGKLFCGRVENRHGTVAFASAAPIAASPPEEKSDTTSRYEGAWDGQWIRSL
ncbi:MAG: hypothetical protein ACREHD_06495, partial [Pirellulales bacterium]